MVKKRSNMRHCRLWQIAAVMVMLVLAGAFFQEAKAADETGWAAFSSVATPVVIDENFSPGLTLSNGGGITVSGGASVTGGTSTDTLTATSTANINVSSGATTNIATGAAATTNIGIAAGTNNITGTNNVVGVTGINVSSGLTTNIATTTAATTNVGVLNGTNNIYGTTSINASTNNATNINTGISNALVTVGNALNTTDLNSHINNIGVTSLTGAATTNNIGTNAAFASTNTMGSINAATTVTAYGGNSTMAVVNNASSLGSVNASVASSNLVGATSGTGGGASVVLSGAAPTANTTQYTVDGAGHIIANTVNGTTPATASTAAFVLSNGYGANHGMIVTEGQTTVSGGTHSTSMTLNDNGATFRNQYGTAATVSGVADGKARYDAVNFGQLRDVYGGVAAASALAGIPNPAPGKSFVIGMGYGNFMSTSAFAFGAKAALTKNLMVQFGVGFSPNNNQTYSAGLGWSF